VRFGPAIDDVIHYGKFARRECWPDCMYIGFRLPDNISDLTGAYFYMRGENHGEEVTVPWSPDTFDMTGHDWEFTNETGER